MFRLKTRGQFQAVLAGERVASSAHFALHRCALDTKHQQPAPGTAPLPGPPRLFLQDGVWFGAMVPKRWAKRAVTRNTIKRQIYTVSSRFESQFPMAAHVVRLRSGFDRGRFASASSDALKLAVRTELEQLFASTTRSVLSQRPPKSPQ